MKHPLRHVLGDVQHAILALADGAQFHGVAIGAAGAASGEVVCHTAMTGYQEILSDPSYSRQIVTLTDLHIGNTGIHAEDAESPRIHAAGLLIRDLPLLASNFRSTQSLPAWLREHDTVAIAGIGTRKLTRILREKGAQNHGFAVDASTLPAHCKVTQVSLFDKFMALMGGNQHA